MTLSLFSLAANYWPSPGGDPFTATHGVAPYLITAIMFMIEENPAVTPSCMLDGVPMTLVTNGRGVADGLGLNTNPSRPSTSIAVFQAVSSSGSFTFAVASAGVSGSLPGQGNITLYSTASENGAACVLVDLVQQTGTGHLWGNSGATLNTVANGTSLALLSVEPFTVRDSTRLPTSTFIDTVHIGYPAGSPRPEGDFRLQSGTSLTVPWAPASNANIGDEDGRFNAFGWDAFPPPGGAITIPFGQFVGDFGSGSWGSPPLPNTNWNLIAFSIGQGAASHPRSSLHLIG